MTVFRLQAELLLRRHGWLPLCAVLAIAAALWLYGVATARLQEKIDAYQAELASLARRPPPPRERSPSQPEARYATFRERLGERQELPKIVKTLFVQADKHHLVLKQADYKFSRDSSGEYRAYRISLPVKGGYADIRRFCAGVLTEIHAAALEEIDFKRDGIGTPVTEAHLRFVVYLKPGDEP